ncbi:hypothetical protein PG990_015348 [Apiospora arundinis]
MRSDAQHCCHLLCRSRLLAQRLGHIILLNATVGGRLIATAPLGAPCHDPSYDEATCQSMQSRWQTEGIHMGSSSSVIAPIFANQSCDAFKPRSRPCELGNYVRYAVNATSVEDIQS